jgi:hypothetical protein
LLGKERDRGRLDLTADSQILGDFMQVHSESPVSMGWTQVKQNAG